MGAKAPILYSVSRNAEDTEVTHPTKHGNYHSPQASVHLNVQGATQQKVMSYLSWVNAAVTFRVQ